MRGGKRDGAGRKRSEPTVRVSVPAGALDSVLALIAIYKQGELNDSQTIKEPYEAKKTDSSPVSQPAKPAPAAIDSEAIKKAKKHLEQLPTRLKKSLVKQYGSLFNAARERVRVESL